MSIEQTQQPSLLKAAFDKAGAKAFEIPLGVQEAAFASIVHYGPMLARIFS
jgi:hypothetical protein